MASPRALPPGDTTPGLGDLGPLGELSVAAGIDLAVLRALVESAVADAQARLLPGAPPVRVVLDPTGGLRLEREEAGVAVSAALSPEVARGAAHAVKAAVAELRRDAERLRVVSEGMARRGELADAIVERREGRAWHLRIADLGAVLPEEEQVDVEALVRGQHLKVLVLDVRRHGEALLEVSRSHPVLLRRLLEQEVPELSTGQVTIRALAREAGRRSKVAVDAEGEVDPEGACIGPRGVRIRAVVADLGQEQVQILRWSPDPATYVARSLGPAEVVGVDLDEETRTAHVRVPDHQLSLAIGRSGENARLAARLTGWRIDISGTGGAS